MRVPRSRPSAVAVTSAALLGALLLAPTGATAADERTTARPAKIATELVSLFKDEAAQDFWVQLNVRADNAGARVMSDWNARGAAVAANLRSVAAASQAPVRELLEQQGVAYESFWISNAIKVTGGSEALAAELAALAVVAQVFPPVDYVQEEPLQGTAQPRVDAVEWGIADINANDVWAQYGFTGEGIVIANIDTGVEYDHPALVEQYRGNLGNGQFDHNYSWYDAAGDSPNFPADTDLHGTHTMGTMVGDDGGANQVGVAPGARWIAANGCCVGDTAALASMQWMLEPTDLQGNNPDASKRPNIVSNSWGVSTVPTDPFGDDIQQAWIDSGIFATWSNRNLGPSCDSTGSPGGRVLSYSSGAYDINHVIADFSSRGPGQDDVIKPNLSGPGVDVRSSVPGGYDVLSGTSMSTPHTAGTVALLWSAAPTLIGDIDGTREILDQSAVDVDALECGGTVDDNNVFGEGRLDALAAVASAPIGDSGTVSGTVTDAATGDPIAGATVHFSGPSDRDVVTAADGSFEVLLQVGTYDVEVSAFGYVSESEVVEVAKDETVTLDVTLVAAPSYSLAGRVTDKKTGERLSDVTVEVEGTPLETTTNAKGRYTFAEVPAGTYDVTATGDGCYLPRTKTVVIDGVRQRLAPLATDEKKKFKLKAVSDSAGNTCRTEPSAYAQGDTALALTGDDAVTTVALPFDFPFYGAAYDSVEVSTNGHLRFLPTFDAAYANQLLPDPTPPNAVVAALWDDLVVDASSTLWTGAGAGSFTVEYRNVTFYGALLTERVDVEVTLFDSGEILLAYRGIDQASGLEAGSSATVGIENADGTIGLMYASYQPVLEDATAIRFMPGS